MKRANEDQYIVIGNNGYDPIEVLTETEVCLTEATRCMEEFLRVNMDSGQMTEDDIHDAFIVFCNGKLIRPKIEFKYSVKVTV